MNLIQNIKSYPMKNINLILIIVFFSSNLLAISSLGDGEKKCRLDVTNNDVTLSIEQQLNIDLLSGVWTTNTFYAKDLKSSTSLQFAPNGIVGTLTETDENITSYSHRIWNLEMINPLTPVLVLTDLKTNQENMYQITRHCDGLDLLHVKTGEKTQLLYHDKQKTKALTTTIKTLTGDWKCMMLPNSPIAKRKKINSAFYQYKLHKDGTIEKTLDAKNMTAIVQHGFWQVSPDGQYLLMHFEQDGQFKTSVAKINHLAFDELVLGQCTATSDTEEGLCADMDSFYFNKQ